MSKSYEETAAELLIAAIAKAPSSGNLEKDAKAIAAAFKIIYQAVYLASSEE